tara:strand:- start:1195 stop:2337 length:1143 start_codon:yes stop_codon:yes gene_type:complete
LINSLKENRIIFNSSPKPTIGVEAELYTISNENYNLFPAAPEILSSFKNDKHITEELLECIVEVNTNICNDVSEVRSDLYEKINKVRAKANIMGVSLVSMGTHPFAKWKEQRITQSNRYLNFLERMQWPVRRLIISGLHVHIGVESGEKAIAITNGLLRYIPILIGISANSPFFDGELTGLLSTRTKIFEGLPTTGLPPYLKNYSDFQKFMRILQHANTIESIREVWWDIRPHPGFGTVEVRVCDAVPTIEEMVLLTALIQCLVVGLSNYYDEGSQLEILQSWIIEENKWRATRNGLNADIIVDENGNIKNLKIVSLDLIEKLLEISIDLNCNNELNELANNIENNNVPYIRQINEFNKRNDFNDIIKMYIAELNYESNY